MGITKRMPLKEMTTLRAGRQALALTIQGDEGLEWKLMYVCMCSNETGMHAHTNIFK